MSNEIKIGLLTLITLIAGLWAYNFIKGQDIFNKTKVLYAEYQNVDGLREGASVRRSGVKVGGVTAVYLNPENLRTVIVEFTIQNDLQIPKTTIAHIMAADLLGEKAVILDFDKPCNGADCTQNGDYIKGNVKGILASMVGSPKDVKKYVDVVTDGVKGTIDSLGTVAGDEDSAVGKALADVTEVLANLKTSTAQLNNIVAQNRNSINHILSDVESLAGNIEAKNSEIQSIISNVDTFSNQLAGLDLGKTLSTTEGTIQSLNTTLQNTQETIGDFNKLIAQVKNGEGTVGQLLTNDSLHVQLVRTLQNMDYLMQDIRLNPKRYTTVLRKKSPTYSKPEDDPAFKEN